MSKRTLTSLHRKFNGNLPAQPRKVEYVKFMGQTLEVNVSPGQHINLAKEVKRQVERARLLRLENNK